MIEGLDSIVIEECEVESMWRDYTEDEEEDDEYE